MSRAPQMGPLILSDTVTLAINEEKQLFAKAKLNNPLKTPMWVDEIIFSIGSTSFKNSGGTYPFSAWNTGLNYGGVISAKLFLDRTALTNGYVPLWNFGRAINTTSYSNVASTMLTDAPQVFVWHLPKPLWMSPDAILTPTVKRTNEGSIANVTVRCTVLGRAINSSDPVPKTIDVPWVASWVGATRSMGTDNTDQSEGQHLVNPFAVPLKVQRFIGRIKATTSDGTTTVTEAMSQGSDNNSDSAAYSQWLLVRMNDSRGRIVVRDYTPFGLLFNQVDRSWSVDALLNPREYYKVLLDEKFSNITGTDKLTPHISMVGYRTLEIHK